MYHDNELYGGGLIGQIRRMIVTEIYGSHYTRGTLRQDVNSFSSNTGPEDMMMHRIVADPDLAAFQEGTSTATTNGGPATTGAGL